MRLALSWICYWLGDAISRVMDYWPSEHCHPYVLYNRLMEWSSDLQGAGPNGPWSAISED